MKLEPLRKKKGKISRLNLGVLVEVDPQITFQAINFLNWYFNVEWNEAPSSSSFAGIGFLYLPLSLVQVLNDCRQYYLLRYKNSMLSSRN